MPEPACHNENWSRLQKGDPEALLGLHQAYYVSLFNYGVKLCGNHLLVQDSITQVLLHLWDIRHSLPSVKNHRSYLLTCLRNELYAQLKAENNRKSRQFSYLSTEGPEPSYEDLLIARQTHDELKTSLGHALKNLTPRERDLLQLKIFDDLDYEEIANKCGITKRTAYNIIHTALKNLRKNLSQNTGNHHVIKTTISLLFPLLLALRPLT